MNQRTWGAEDSFVLYFSLFYYFSLFSLFLVSSLINLALDFDSLLDLKQCFCSEVLKLKFNVETHLRLLFEFNELKTNARTHFFN